MSEALLDSGAILLGAKAKADDLDTLTARRYTHPVLPERTVVRLVGQTLGQAEDLSMEFLGFVAQADAAHVGQVRRQALGFPAWALVNDPANGRHALALVKEMERLARVAKSKPGNAKDGYDQLALRLDQAAAHFLPTFWEQAGRAFVAADNARMAGTCFTEARRAEQVHGLGIDEERLREVHLEFAFSGALTAKMLTEYARGVVQRKPAGEAYELVRALAVRRVAGGLAPYASMADDLSRLAKAAGLDPLEQAALVVAQLLRFPAMVRSHLSVWKSYRKALVRLAQRDAGARLRLLEIIPEPPGYETFITDDWLELLEATGVHRDLLTPGGPVSPGKWLEKFTSVHQHVRKRSARLLSLVEGMAPLMRAEGRPLNLWPGSVWGSDPDLIDLLLACGVAVTHDRHYAVHVDRWAADAAAGRRDLSAIASDEHWRPLLEAGVRDALSNRSRNGGDVTSPAFPDETIAARFGTAGVQSVLRHLVAGLAIGNGTLVSLNEAMTKLSGLWSPAGVALAREGFAALQSVDVPQILAATLRAGLLDELSWPQYEQAARQTPSRTVGRHTVPLAVVHRWPDLIVHDNQSAHVIRPDGTVEEHVFRFPPPGHPMARDAHAHVYCEGVGDQILVSWYAEGRTMVGYWSANPDEIFETAFANQMTVYHVPTMALPIPGGGVTTGTRPWHVGDSKPPAAIHPVISDGVTFWRYEQDAQQQSEHWREFDPATGGAGRVSMPSFFTGELAEGASLHLGLSRIHPAPQEFSASPMGWRDGLVGWRVMTLPDGTQIGEGIDGGQVTWRPLRRTRSGGRPTGLLGAVLLPGAQRHSPVTGPEYPDVTEYTLWTEDGKDPVGKYAVSRYLPPLAWWHALRPRDEVGSQKLRQADAELAKALLEFEFADRTHTEASEAIMAKVLAHLPEVTDERLRGVIAESVRLAARLQHRLAGLPALLEIEPPSEPQPMQPMSDERLQAAWQGLAGFGSLTYYYATHGGMHHHLLAQIKAVAALLSGQKVPPVPASVSPVWAELMAGPGAVALRAASPVSEVEHREALAVLLSTLAQTPMADAGANMRALAVVHSEKPPENAEVLRDGGQVTVLLGTEEHWNNNVSTWKRTAIQLAPGGKFTAPPGTPSGQPMMFGGWSGSARLAAFCQLLEQRGPAPWRPEAATRLAQATGMTQAEACLLLAGLPEIDSWTAGFITAKQRAVMGLSAAAARVARDALHSVPHAQRIAVLDAAMPADPLQLWESGPDIDAMAAAWIRLRGARVPIPEHLLSEAAAVLPKNQAAEILQGFADPPSSRSLTTDGVAKATDWGPVKMVAKDGQPAFDTDSLQAAASGLAWLAYRLHWGDPLRQKLPEVIELVRQRLRNPNLLVGAGVHREGERPEVGAALVPGDTQYGSVLHYLAPVHLTSPDDPAIGFMDPATAGAVWLMLSEHADAIASTPQGKQGDARDPRVCVPELVSEVAKTTGLAEEPAVCYLQLLALPDPTDRHVQDWNGWKAPQLKKAQQSLLEANLVVQGKRERAGRTVFLPGGWLAAKAPDTPMETWKEQLYVTLFGRTVVITPHAQLFQAAWERITAGDVPRYLEMKETR